MRVGGGEGDEEEGRGTWEPGQGEARELGHALLGGNVELQTSGGEAVVSGNGCVTAVSGNTRRYRVGDRVQVYWDGEDTWFCGIVEQTREGKIQVITLCTHHARNTV